MSDLKKFSTKEFLKVVNEKYDNKYLYPNFKYQGMNYDIIIHCRKHGNFTQRTYEHLNGTKTEYCKTCIFENLKNDLTLIHNNKYNYNKLQNINTHHKNIITCLIHGDFEQSIHSHKQGNGCKKCAIKNSTHTFDFFIKKANKTHKNKYDYSKFEYINASTNSIIICPQHGEFSQSPNSHYAYGCKKCAGNEKYTNETFKKQFYKYFPNSKFILDHINYINSNTKITIECPLHDEPYFFKILPRSFLRGSGCNKCGGTKKLTQKEFLNIANKLHNNKYDYSKVKYINTREKITIICHNHTPSFEFSSVAGTHIHNKRGCPKCAHIISKPETKWLKSLNNPNIIKQKTITINGRRFRFDGFDPTTNTVYEFYGDFWHGNPKKFDQDTIHPIKKINRAPVTYGELYQFTLDGEQILKENGYNVVSIWESDFKLD